jgi:hypothetical protein
MPDDIMKSLPQTVIIPHDRIITKSTTCANCIHYDAASQSVLEEWKRRKASLVAAVKMSPGGLQIEVFERPEATLAVAHLMGQGMTSEAAHLAFEQHIIIMLQKMVGPGGDLYQFDKRIQKLQRVDDDLHSGKAGACRGSGVDKDGGEVFLVYSAHHCHKWTGREGWSVAHGSNRLDPLPDELEAIADDKARKV